MPVPIKAYLGTVEIVKRYIGSVLIFDNTGPSEGLYVEAGYVATGYVESGE